MCSLIYDREETIRECKSNGIAASSKRLIVYEFDLFWPLIVSVGSLSKYDVEDSENVIWKWNFAFLQSFRNYSKSLHLQLSWNDIGTSASEIRWRDLTFAQVVHTTAKEVISRLRKNENVYRHVVYWYIPLSK